MRLLAGPGPGAAAAFLRLVHPKLHRPRETALDRSAFPDGMRLDYPERPGFWRETSARRLWQNGFGMNRSRIRKVGRKIKERNQL